MKKILSLIILLSITTALKADTFDNVISIFESKCQSCHNAESPAGNLDLTGTKSAIHDAIFEAAPSNYFSILEDHKIVDAGYPSRSSLYRTINDGLYENIQLDDNENVHAGADLGLEDWEKEMIRQWIFHGAKESGTIATGRKETLIEFYEEGGLPRMEKPEAPAEGEGFQLYLGSIFLEPGQEWEMVYKYELKNEEAFEVSRIDATMSDFSHHFLFFDYYNDAHQNVDEGFRTIDILSFLTGSAISLGESGTNMIAGWAYSDDLKLPEGTAFNWEEDLVLKFNYHVKNYSNTQVYPTDLYVNVYTQEQGTAVMEMKSDFLINAGDFGSSIPATCDTIFNSDRRRDFSFGNQNDSLHIWNLGAHTHQLGVDYDIYLSDANGNKGEQVYEGMYNYEQDIYTGIYDYAEPSFRFFNDDFLTIRKGDGLIQEGAFVNCTGSSVFYGLTTNDEMLGFFTQYLVGDLTELFAYQDSVANVIPANNTNLALEELNVSVKPNPSNGIFNIALENVNLNNGTIEVFDLTGKKVVNQIVSDKNTRIDIQDLTAGIYLLKITVDGKQKTQKITKF